MNLRHTETTHEADSECDAECCHGELTRTEDVAGSGLSAVSLTRLIFYWLRRTISISLTHTVTTRDVTL